MTSLAMPQPTLPPAPTLALPGRPVRRGRMPLDRARLRRLVIGAAVRLTPAFYARQLVAATQHVKPLVLFGVSSVPDFLILRSGRPFFQSF